jgi:hypothetical protein
LDISHGTVVVGGTQDPFTDNHATGLGTGDTAGNHVAIQIDNNAKLQIAQHQSTITVAGVNITSANAVLDVGDNALMIHYGNGPDPVSSIAALLASGYNNGAWNGPGIDTSAPVVFNGLTYGLGYADSADPQEMATQVPSGTVEVKYTLLGDADLNGIVNGLDFGVLAANFNKGISGWDEGDFDYNGIINGLDFGDLAANFNKGVDGAAGLQALGDPALVAFAEANGLMADVPEPATASLVVLAGAGILARRRRK